MSQYDIDTGYVVMCHTDQCTVYDKPFFCQDEQEWRITVRWQAKPKELFDELLSTMLDYYPSIFQALKSIEKTLDCGRSVLQRDTIALQL